MTTLKLHQLNPETRELKKDECHLVAGGWIGTAIAIAGGITNVLQGYQQISIGVSGDVPQQPLSAPNGSTDSGNPNQAAINAKLQQKYAWRWDLS